MDAISTLCLKKVPTIKLSVTWSNLRNLLQNPYEITHLTLGVLLHYLKKYKIQNLCRHSAIIPDMEENANNVDFKCTDFNSSTRITVYFECIYVFLSKSCRRR